MTDHDPKRTRLGALKALGAAAAGLVGGTLVGKETTSASAATGGSLTIGSTANAAEDQTKLTVDATLPANTSAFVVEAADANAAIEGNSSSIGVLGNATTGVMGVGNVGGVFSGDANAIQLNPQNASGAPTAGDHLKGDILVDLDGVLWLCIADGAPGTWIRVSHGGVRPISPQRAYSTTEEGGAFANGETRSVPIAGHVAGVPAEAVGITGNLTIHGTHGGGYVTLWPTGEAQPSTSNINWWTDGISIANGFVVGLGADGAISLFAAGTQAVATDLIVDVTGYVL